MRRARLLIATVLAAGAVLPAVAQETGFGPSPALPPPKTSLIPTVNVARVTLLRDADGDGRPETRSVFLSELHSPFGMALVGNDFCVADALLRFPYQPGQTKIEGDGIELADLPGGHINHHWTKSLVASPDGTKLFVGVGSNSLGAWRRLARRWAA